MIESLRVPTNADKKSMGMSLFPKVSRQSQEMLGQAK